MHFSLQQWHHFCFYRTYIPLFFFFFFFFTRTDWFCFYLQGNVQSNSAKSIFCIKFDSDADGIFLSWIYFVRLYFEHSHTQEQYYYILIVRKTEIIIITFEDFLIKITEISCFTVCTVCTFVYGNVSRWCFWCMIGFCLLLCPVDVNIWHLVQVMSILSTAKSCLQCMKKTLTMQTDGTRLSLSSISWMMLMQKSSMTMNKAAEKSDYWSLNALNYVRPRERTLFDPSVALSDPDCWEKPKDVTLLYRLLGLNTSQSFELIWKRSLTLVCSRMLLFWRISSPQRCIHSTLKTWKRSLLLLCAVIGVNHTRAEQFCKKI